MFGRSTKKIVEEVSKSVPKTVFEINSEKPGKGNFIISVNDEILVDLKSLPRPFKALRDLDLVAVAEQIVDKLQ